MPSHLVREYVAGGGSTAIVSSVLNPIDVVKTRRQLERHSRARAVDIARELWREGGVIGLWTPGLSATIARELVYSGCTKGLYAQVRDAISGTREPSLLERALAASTCGFLGSLGANALDVIKVRQFDQPGR